MFLIVNCLRCLIVSDEKYDYEIVDDAVEV